MSEERFSLGEFSSILKNEDSDGFGLAEYLQNRKGATRRRHNRVFRVVEMPRASLNVKVKKINNAEEGKTTADAEHEVIPTEKKSAEISVVNGLNTVQKENECQIENIPPCENLDSVHININLKSSGHTSLPTSPVANIRSPAKIFSLRKNSPCNSDRLRRYSLKRLSSKGCGRMLLKEFESTLASSDFQPAICSTPMSNTSKPNAVENCIVFSPQRLESDEHTIKSNTANVHKESSVVEINNVQQQIGDNEKLQQMVENIVETTLKKVKENENLNDSKPNSNYTVQRLYTIKSGNKKGEVILSTCPTSPYVQSQGSLCKEQNVGDGEVTSALGRSANKNAEQEECNVLNTPVPNNINTQIEKQTPQKDRIESYVAVTSINKSAQSNQVPDSSKSVSQTDNYTYTIPSKVVACTDTQKQNNTIAQEEDEINIRRYTKSPQINELQLRLNDIITEDEDECGRQNNSASIPLNLVSNNQKSARIKRLRKRSSFRRSSQNNETQSTASNIEMFPPRAHPLNLQCPGAVTPARKRRPPLNKAPSTPINGEKFANDLKTHLARLTNNQILDLRKRNSLGKVFPVSGRKSIIEKKHAIEKQQQLEKEIESEIRVRSTQDNNDKLHDENVLAEVLPEEQILSNFDDYICSVVAPAPEGFRDSTTDANINNSKLLPNGTITQTSGFMNAETFVGGPQSVQVCSKQSSRIKGQKRRKSTPIMVKNYLNVKTKIGKSMRYNISKRSLYSKGYSDTENSTIDDENAVHAKNSCEPTSSYTPTTPQNKSNHSSNLSSKILEPPEPFTDQYLLDKGSANNAVNASTSSQPSDQSLRKSFHKEELTFLKPQRRKSRQTVECNGSVRLAETEQNSVEPEEPIVDNDVIFKKPKTPKKRPPRKARVQQTVSSTTENEAQISETDSQDENLTTKLRRSKRGHIPRTENTATIFQLLFQKQMERSEQRRIKTNTSRQGCSIAKSSETTNSHISTNSTNTRRRGRKKKIVESPYSLLGDTTSASSSCSVAKGRHLSPIMEPLVEVGEPIRPSIGFQHNRIAMDSAPVHHLNEIFDELKNANNFKHVTADTSPSDSAHTSSSEGSTKMKKLCVRLKRLNVDNVPSEKTSTTNNGEHSGDVHTQKCSNSNMELLSWLKGLSDMKDTTGRSKFFEGMHCSLAGNMVFTDLEGIDYAFYDTDDKASLGYLRFKPQQTKPPKRAKKHILNFIVLSGDFEFGTNYEKDMFHTGDMIAIDKGVRYTIRNVSQDVGLLMVIKK